MATRRSNGEGGLSWNEARQRWVGRASLGYNADGKRRIGTVSARTKTEAKNKLRALLRDHDDGLPTQRAYTVGDAVEAWLAHGLVGRDPNTVAFVELRGLEPLTSSMPSTVDLCGGPALSRRLDARVRR
jgi:hypothetical protein